MSSDSSDSSSDEEMAPNLSKQLSLLELVLNDDHDTAQEVINDSKTSITKSTIESGTCIECEEHRVEVHCIVCEDSYCNVCFHMLHRTGTRRKHNTRSLVSLSSHSRNKQDIEETKVYKKPKLETKQPSRGMISSMVSTVFAPVKYAYSYVPSFWSASANDPVALASWWKEIPTPEWFIERSKYVPVRLPVKHRKYMRLVKAILSVSEYTDKVDLDFKTISVGRTQRADTKRMVAQLKGVCSVLSAVLTTNHYEIGVRTLQDNDFGANAEFIQQIFEIGRRHKVRNPEKMRASYGKLMYLLQDTQSRAVNELLSFSCIMPVKTVFSRLEALDAKIEGDGFALLKDELFPIATTVILTDGRNRKQIDEAIRKKENAQYALQREYACHGFSEEAVRECIMAFNDNHSFLLFNRDPVEAMLIFLTTYFDPNTFKTNAACLAINSGTEGARLTHSHQNQYYYCLQTLRLWRDIQHNMFELWSAADLDLLDTNNSYELKQTAQGLQRIQKSPRVFRIMNRILSQAQRDNPGEWIGSSVVHLGDENVPNALAFIDKYTQVPRILQPIVSCIRQLPELSKQKNLQRIFARYGSLERLRLEILGDFFRKAFDGSGADNFFAAGSCIDGRLTSAWHWCSELSQKSFYPLFLLSGFTSFDGEFDND